MFGVKKFLFAAGYLEDAHTSYALSQKSDDFYATIGIHPCRALEPYLKVLTQKENPVEEGDKETSSHPTNADSLSKEIKQ